MTQPVRYEAVIWTNADLAYCRIYLLLGIDGSNEIYKTAIETAKADLPKYGVVCGDI